MRDLAAYSYEAVAAIYDELAALYSLGRIERSKQSRMDLLVPGERVLFAGVGRGSDAISAARLGARVTAVDLSPRMLGRLADGLAREGLEAELIEADIATYRTAEPYDTVVAHYFLNLFTSDEAAEAFAVLYDLVRPGGRMIFADFAAGEGGRLGRWLTAAYYRPANWIAWAVGFCALHPIPDYRELVEAAGGRVTSVIRYPLVRGFANPAYHSTVAERGPEAQRFQPTGAEPQGVSGATASVAIPTGSSGDRSSSASSSRSAARSTRSGS